MSILLYFDGSDYMKQALTTVTKHAKILNTHVDVVSSVSRGNETQLGKIRKMKGGLMDMKAALEKEQIPCETYLLMEGRYAGDDVVRFAEEHGSDEIIIGAAKKTRIQKLILGSVEQYVILNADCPVIIT
jgi:nucleotide-binding universal stress UspA family protein